MGFGPLKGPAEGVVKEMVDAFFVEWTGLGLSTFGGIALPFITGGILVSKSSGPAGPEVIMEISVSGPQGWLPAITPGWILAIT